MRIEPEYLNNKGFPVFVQLRHTGPILVGLIRQYRRALNFSVFLKYQQESEKSLTPQSYLRMTSKGALSLGHLVLL